MRDNLDLAIDELSYDLDEGYDELRTFTKTCNRCDEGNLHWSHSKEGWRLADSKGKIHSCKNKLVLLRKVK